VSASDNPRDNAWNTGQMRAQALGSPREVDRRELGNEVGIEAGVIGFAAAISAAAAASAARSCRRSIGSSLRATRGESFVAQLLSERREH